jgi:hypothetical protein
MVNEQQLEPRLSRRKGTKLVIGLLLVATAGVVLWQALRLSQPEPVYRGKRLSLWLSLGPSSFDSGADEFLRQNSLVVTSYLLAALNRRDNPFWKPYTWVIAHSPAFLSSRLPPWVEPRLVRAGATYWLAQLGPQARPAVPDLRHAASMDQYPEVRRSAVWALGRVDSASKESVALLVAAMCQDKDANVRRAAAGVLEVWSPDDPAVILALVQGLKDSDTLVRQISAAALGKCGARAIPSLEPLRDLASSNDPAADYAARALEQIHRDSSR